MKTRETQFIWLTIAASSLTILIGFGQLFISHHQHAVQAKSTIAVTRPAAKPKAPTPIKIDWHQPSMRKAYPTLSNYADLNIQVSIKQQRVYLKNNDHVLYTMRASTGKQGSETPRGHFEIQPERGLTSLTPSPARGPIIGSPSKTTASTSFTRYPWMKITTILSRKPNSSGKWPIHTAASACRLPMPSGCTRISRPIHPW